jgi:hypothetical protein
LAAAVELIEPGGKKAAQAWTGAAKLLWVEFS